MSNTVNKKNILIISIIVVVCILAIVLGCVFGIKCTVTLEHFYLVPETPEIAMSKIYSAILAASAEATTAIIKTSSFICDSFY